MKVTDTFLPLLNPDGPDPFYPHHVDWNTIVFFLAERSSISARGFLELGGPKHPWKTNVSWNDDLGIFVAKVRPGFLRGHDIMVRSIPYLLPNEAKTRLGYSQFLPPTLTDYTDFSLCDEPQIPLPNTLWRDVITSNTVQMVDQPTEALPEALLEQFNILKPPKLRKLSFGGFELPSLQVDISEQLSQDKGTARLLKSLEVYVEVPRPRIGLLEAQTGEDFRVLETFIDYATVRSFKPRLQIKATKPVEMEAQNSFTVAQALGAEDDGIDACHIATIWLVGPEGDLSAKAVTNEWLPVVQHTTFYNLDYTVNTEVNTLPPLRQANPAAPLPSGVFAQPFVDSINAANREAEQAYANASVNGKFWTI